jgi:tetratricopeptide (TPR) repeat protein
MTGLASPARIVRRGETPERRLVALTAARLVDQDFGLTGTVLEVRNDRVEVAIKGGGLGEPLGRRVKRGDVFRVVRLTEEAGKPRSTLLDLLLQVADEPRDGVCRCNLYHGYEGNPLREGPGLLGYRCLRITTIRAPLRLRLLDEKKGTLLNAVRVKVGKTLKDSRPWERTTGLDGLIVTPDSYANVAFVNAYSGGSFLGFRPVAIEDEQVVPFPVDLDPEAVAAGDFVLQRDRWVERTKETLNVIRSRFDLKDVRTAQAGLALARQAVKEIPVEVDRLKQEGKELLASAGKFAAGLDLSDGERNLRALEESRGQFTRVITELENAIQQDALTQRLQTVLVRARALEGQAEFAEAIKLYESVLTQRPDSPQVKVHLEKLRAAWQTKDDAHVKAREFIYGTWARLEPSGLKAEIEHASKALAVCRAHGDRLTSQKLRQVNDQHAAKLIARLKALSREADSEDNRATTNALLSVSARLRQLQAEVTAFLSAGKSGSKE